MPAISTIAAPAAYRIVVPMPPVAGSSLPDAPKKKGGAGLNIMIALFAIVLLGGIGLIVYPTFANWWNSMHASRAVAICSTVSSVPW